ncbi:MAG: helix-turn-helix domain-containing protein [Patescibacteria group bacterium]
MNTETILLQAGFDAREAKVYVALLELGESTVLPLSKKAGIKRTYCYDILASLQEKGLVSFIPRNGRRRYSAEPPETIKALLKQRLDTFSEGLSELKSIYNKSDTKPVVRFYEGVEGIKSVYEQLISVKSFDAISSPDQLYRYLGDYFEDFAKRAIQKKERIRELIAGPIPEVSYLQEYEGSERWQWKKLPETVSITTDILLFENKLVMISYGKQLHAIVLEGSAIVDTHKQLFELLWNQADQAATRTFTAKQSGSFEDEE